MKIHQYEQYLYGCRFCPMCKPFGEVSNVTKDEAHSTRVRGMLLWQVASGKVPWDENTAKIVYESSLNSVNQTWCISHYPVPAYILAARADIVEAGLAPASVQDYSIVSHFDFAAAVSPFAAQAKDTIFYPGDALAADDPGAAIAALKILSVAGEKPRLPDKLNDSGALAYCLGKVDLALEQAGKVGASIAGASTVLVDGPLSLWALTRVYPQLGVKLSDKVRVCLMIDRLLELQAQGKLALPSKPLKAYAVGSEFSRLVDVGYDAFRRLLGVVSGLQVIESADGLELAHSSGASGGLHLVAPGLGKAVSQQRIEEARNAGVDWIVCESALDSAHIRSVAGSQLSVGTFAELLTQ